MELLYLHQPGCFPSQAARHLLLSTGDLPAGASGRYRCRLDAEQVGELRHVGVGVDAILWVQQRLLSGHACRPRASHVRRRLPKDELEPEHAWVRVRWNPSHV